MPMVNLSRHDNGRYITRRRQRQAVKLSTGCRRVVHLPISGLYVTTLIDTGASVSLIDTTTYLQICEKSHRPVIKDTSNFVFGLGGNNLETLGSAQVDVASVGLITVLIVKDLGY